MNTSPYSKQATSSPRPLLSPTVTARMRECIFKDEPPLPDDVSLPSIKGYRLEYRIGSGGQGEVFKGWRDGLDGPIAVKVLNRPSRLGQIFRVDESEILLLKSLRLACVPLFDGYGLTEQANQFVAMEYIDGVGIDQYCDSHGLDLRNRVVLLVKVAGAVDALHQRGIIHRDLKPAHALVTPAGHVMLIDLGIAKHVEQDNPIASNGTKPPFGTLDYMAPEQARGDHASIRSDICALGGIAYRVLTGHRPRDLGNDFGDAIRRVAETPARDPTFLAETPCACAKKSGSRTSK